MNENILTALIAFLGTVCGSAAGIITSGRLTAHRLDRLERKVDLHNNAVERIVVLECRINTLDRTH